MDGRTGPNQYGPLDFFEVGGITNHNRSTALERSVINHWELKPVLRAHNLVLGSAVVHEHEVIRSA